MDGIEFNKLIKQAKENLSDVLPQRNKEYGEFKKIAEFTNLFFINNMLSINERIREITQCQYDSVKTAIFMIGLKLARLENQTENPHLDSITDFLGYLELLKQTKIKSLVLRCNLKTSKLHKNLIEYANAELQQSDK